VLAAGPRVFDSQGDPLSIPELAPMSAVGMTAENTTVPESDPVFSEVQLLPASLKSFKRGYRISNELVRHGVLAIATVMGQAIVERTALEIDAAMLTGTGAANTITGFTSMAVPAGRGQVRHQAAERRRRLHHHHRVMAEQKGAKAPEKTAEGLRPGRRGAVRRRPRPTRLCRLWSAVAGDQPARPLEAVSQRL
jgi:hypothetical protein